MRTQLLLLAVAGVAVAGTPSYGAMCVGSTTTARACVNRDVTVTPTGGPVSYSDCVVVGDPDTCTPVNVSSPNVVVTGPAFPASVECYVCTALPDVPEVPDTRDCGDAIREWQEDEGTPDAGSATRLRTAITGCVL